MMLQIR